MFPVMDPKFERMHTTKGIWISRCIDSSMLILDITGLDHRQGGKDTSFENQAALFALTISDIIMVSISIFNNDLDQGGSELFMTIFQERTKLLHRPTKIVVIVQNYDGQKPLEGLRQNVVETLEQIWTSVNEKSKEFSDYIEITEVVGVLAKNSDDLRQQVTMWKKSISANVAPSSFSVRSKALWDQIKQNERVDLPTHMMLLATLYCQQTAEARIRYSEERFVKAEESPLEFAEVVRSIADRSKAQYNQKLEMYDACVRDKEHTKMVNEELIRTIQEKQSRQFNVEFGKSNSQIVMNLGTTQEGDDVLLKYYEKSVGPYVMIFTSLCEGLRIIDPDYFENNCGVLLKDLTLYIALHVLSLKEEYARKTLEAEQIKFDKEKDALTAKIDERKKDKQLRDMEIQNEKELHKKEIQKAKEELELAKSKRDEEASKHENTKRAKEDFERRVQVLEQNKGGSGGPVDFLVSKFWDGKNKNDSGQTGALRGTSHKGSSRSRAPSASGNMAPPVLAIQSTEHNKEKFDMEELESRVHMLEQKECKCEKEQLGLRVHMLEQNKDKLEKELELIFQRLEQNKDKREEEELQDTEEESYSSE